MKEKIRRWKIKVRSKRTKEELEVELISGQETDAREIINDIEDTVEILEVKLIREEI